MDKRGALFYIIDAFVAAGIIAVTITIVFSIFLNVPENEYNTEAMTNYYAFFEETKLLSAPSTTAVELARNGTITKPRANLFAAITELAYKDEMATINDLIEETTSVALESHYGTTFVLINDTGTYELYRRGTQARQDSSKFLLNRRTTSSFKKEPRIITTNENMLVGQSGDGVCDPATCLYVTDGSGTIDVRGCGSSVGAAGYQARCRAQENGTIFGPVIFEVTIWA